MSNNRMNSSRMNSSRMNSNKMINRNHPLKTIRNDLAFSHFVSSFHSQTNNPKLSQMTLHVHDFITILVYIGKRQLLKLSSIQFLFLASLSLSYLLRKRTRILWLSIQYFHPRIIAQHMSIRRNRGLYDFLHREDIDKPLKSTIPRTKKQANNSSLLTANNQANPHPNRPNRGILSASSTPFASLSTQKPIAF